MQQERLPPPSYDHDPASLHLPSVPIHDVDSQRTNGVHLPDLRSLGLPEHSRSGHAGDTHMKGQWTPPNFAPQSPQYNSIGAVVPHAAADVGSPMALASVLSGDEQTPHDLTVSMEDADVRIAAEALSGLGNPDFARSPPASTFSPQSLASGRNVIGVVAPQRSQSQDPEPLLRLLTTSHPWLGQTISGSMYAYDGAKHYSPRFVRGTAEFVERNIGSPMVNTVGYVSRQTGVDGRIRRYLGSRRRSDEGRNGTPSKRRRVMSGAKVDDLEQGLSDIAEATTPPGDEQRMRTASQSSHASVMSIEPLPAYDSNRSPRYEEMSPPTTTTTTTTTTAGHIPDSVASPQREQQQRNWPTQILVTTSGLGVALSDSSRRSLKYSLSVLRGASDQIGNVLRALNIALDEYVQVQRSDGAATPNEKSQPPGEKMEGLSTANEARSRALAAQIQSLGDNIWAVLRQTIQTISQYTGSALPENAASLVRRQLMSLPQRWRSAATAPASPSDASSGESQTVVAANRIMNFGKESLDMLSQVSLVVSGTIQSAEDWLESLGRRQSDDGVASANGSSHPHHNHQQQQLPQHHQGAQAPFMVAGQPWSGDKKESY